MTVAENVGYGLRVKGVPRARARAPVAEVLATVRLEGYGGRKPVQLSGGQRQRVALARAIVNRPKVLLLDEPLGALDLKLRQEMQVFLKALQRDLGMTFVYVTHDQEEALTMSDRIAVFNEGRIEQVGSPAEVYERPASEFVAGFVGTSNIVERGGRRLCVRPERITLERRTATPATDRGRRLRRRVHAPCSSGPSRRAADSRPSRTTARRSSRARASTSAGATRTPTRSNPPTPTSRRSNDEAHVGAGRRLASASRSPPPAPRRQKAGTLNMIAWEGYLQPQWVKPFEKQCGCTVHPKYAGSSDEMVTLMRSGGGGQYDMVSASGDA